MLTNTRICDQLTRLYPDFGACGDTLNVNWDEENNAWAVDFEYNGGKIRHYLEDHDASACILQDRCVGMGIEFGQFR